MSVASHAGPSTSFCFASGHWPFGSVPKGALTLGSKDKPVTASNGEPGISHNEVHVYPKFIREMIDVSFSLVVRPIK